MPEITQFPDLFRAYCWSKKHALYGYPEDCFPEFEWIESLERRFQWLRRNCESQKTASINLLREMIQWGGSQNGVLQKFEDGIEGKNLQQAMLNTISSLNNRNEAIRAALQFPGLGLTYASKLLRFLDPDHYGALDSRIRGALNERVPGALPKIIQGNKRSMVQGYVAFVEYVDSLKQDLLTKGIKRPECCLAIDARAPSGWRSADVEMALFEWATSGEP